MDDIERRKEEHIEIVQTSDEARGGTSTGLDAIRFEHNALPEIDLSRVDVSATFLGRRVAAPLLVSSMTGGPSRAAALNPTSRRLARNFRSPSVSAPSVLLSKVVLRAVSDLELRRAAPSIPILANFGAAQLRHWNGVDMARRAVEMIEADGLIIHLNPLQEAVQNGGDTDWSGLLDRIEEVCRRSPFPIVVKEVGAGLSGAVARQLVAAGAAVIDVAGAGGTSWAGVEAARASNERARIVASAFRDWGIPTATAIAQVRAACPNTPIIASGGIRDGIDGAKAIRLGADMAGFAASVLPTAVAGTAELITQLGAMIDQMRITCFCTGSRNLKDLRRARLLEPPGPTG